VNNRSKFNKMDDIKLKHETTVDTIRCPITLSIFFDPVVAYDGITYERNAIMSWFTKSNKSPLTCEKIRKSLFDNLLVKNLVCNILNDFPELKNDQYVPNIEYINNKEIIQKFIKKKKFNRLIIYNDYNLNDIIKRDIMSLLIKNCPTNVLKHIFSNSIENKNGDNKSSINYYKKYAHGIFKCKLDNHQLNQLMSLFRFGSIEIIKYCFTNKIRPFYFIKAKIGDYTRYHLDTLKDLFSSMISNRILHPVDLMDLIKKNDVLLNAYLMYSMQSKVGEFINLIEDVSDSNRDEDEDEDEDEFDIDEDEINIVINESDEDESDEDESDEDESDEDESDEDQSDEEESDEEEPPVVKKKRSYKRKLTTCC
jgi:hypothetical protein